MEQHAFSWYRHFYCLKAIITCIQIIDQSDVLFVLISMLDYFNRDFNIWTQIGQGCLPESMFGACLGHFSKACVVICFDISSIAFNKCDPKIFQQNSLKKCHFLRQFDMAACTLWQSLESLNSNEFPLCNLVLLC